jgi:hypothetical protein
MGDRTTRKSWMQQKMQQVGRRERVLEFVSTGCALAGRMVRPDNTVSVSAQLFWSEPWHVSRAVRTANRNWRVN